MSVELFTETSGEQIHDAWRSVFAGNNAGSYDARLHMAHADLMAYDQGLCIVSGEIVDRAIARQLTRRRNFGVAFVRKTMEQIYDGYNRYTACLKGIGAIGLDWFNAGSADGRHQAILAKPPYHVLSYADKEIDRRMVVVGLNNLPDDRLPAFQRHAIRLDAAAILDSAASETPYDPSMGYATEASFD